MNNKWHQEEGLVTSWSMRSAASWMQVMLSWFSSCTLMSNSSSSPITISTCTLPPTYSVYNVWNIILFPQKPIMTSILTVSRESAPSSTKVVWGVSTLSAGKASCFLTISYTFSTVSGFAYTQKHLYFYSLNSWNVHTENKHGDQRMNEMDI